MINIENNDKKHSETTKDEGLVDVARMDVQCHLIIKDKDTEEVLVNKRG